jgi:transposase
MATSDEGAARRTAIQFCVQSGMTPIKTFCQLKSTERYKNVSRALVYKWHGRFSDGYTENTPRGRPKYKDCRTVKSVKHVIDCDRRRTVRDVAEMAGISKSTAQRILTSDLSMSHVSARWVPRLLTEEEKHVRVSASRTFIREVGKDPSYLSRIITTDETWVHYFEPESKQASMVWKHTESPPPKKAKAVKSMGKVMCIVFIDMKGVILVHMVRPGHTVNASYYSQVC